MKAMTEFRGQREHAHHMIGTIYSHVKAWWEFLVDRCLELKMLKSSKK
jgi:hypothetical protein